MSKWTVSSTSDISKLLCNTYSTTSHDVLFFYVFCFFLFCSSIKLNEITSLWLGNEMVKHYTISTFHNCAMCTVLNSHLLLTQLHPLLWLPYYDFGVGRRDFESLMLAGVTTPRTPLRPPSKPLCIHSLIVSEVCLTTCSVLVYTMFVQRAGWMQNLHVRSFVRLLHQYLLSENPLWNICNRVKGDCSLYRVFFQCAGIHCRFLLLLHADVCLPFLLHTQPHSIAFPRHGPNVVGHWLGDNEWMQWAAPYWPKVKENRITSIVAYVRSIFVCRIGLVHIFTSL